MTRPIWLSLFAQYVGVGFAVANRNVEGDVRRSPYSNRPQADRIKRRGTFVLLILCSPAVLLLAAFLVGMGISFGAKSLVDDALPTSTLLRYGVFLTYTAAVLFLS